MGIDPILTDPTPTSRRPLRDPSSCADSHFSSAARERLVVHSHNHELSSQWWFMCLPCCFEIFPDYPKTPQADHACRARHPPCRQGIPRLQTWISLTTHNITSYRYHRYSGGSQSATMPGGFIQRPSRPNNSQPSCEPVHACPGDLVGHLQNILAPAVQ